MSRASTIDAPVDAGFGMVELLIALAIASVVALGIGGLIAFGAELRARTNLVAEVEARLVELNALSATLERLAATNLDRAESNSVYLKKGTTAAGPELMIRLEQAHLVAAVTTVDEGQRDEPRAARIELTGFDEARLEYLVLYDDQHHEWTPRTLGSGVLAVRLVLTKLHRSWPVILWTQPSAGSLR